MMEIKFLGAAGTVTGSSYFLIGDTGRGILIDLGMFQGSEELEMLNRENLDLKVDLLDGVVLTHAHLDHCGRLPLLIQKGFNRPLFMTAPTRDLLELVLRDSARIAEYDYSQSGVEPIYGEEEVERILELSRVVEYNHQFKLGGFEVTLRDAGHILGSASLEVEQVSSGKRIIFSGDLGNSPQIIEKPTYMFESGDAVVMESTYGGRVHEEEDSQALFAREINAVEASGGVMLIPAFSLERTQVILHMIDHLKRDGKVKSNTKVYLDSPMGITATNIYKRYASFYSKHLSEHFRQDDPFEFPGLEVVPKGWQSRQINLEPGAKVIIAGSGMMSGGRIVKHAKMHLGKESTRLLIVGYQGEGTLGRQLLEGAEFVSIEGEKIEVRAKIVSLQSMSAHADEPRLMAWLRHIKGVNQVFLTHGEDESRNALAAKIKAELGIALIELPALRDLMDVVV